MPESPHPVPDAVSMRPGLTIERIQAWNEWSYAATLEQC